MNSENIAVKYRENVLDLPQQTVSETTSQSLRVRPEPSTNGSVADLRSCLTPLHPNLQGNVVRLRSRPALLAITFIARHRLIRSQRLLGEEARARQLQELKERIQVLIFITLGLMISKSYRDHFIDTSPSDTPPHERPVRMRVDLKVEMYGLDIPVGLVLLLLFIIHRQVLEASHDHNSEVRGDGNIVQMNNSTNINNYNHIRGDGNYVAEIGTMEKVTSSAKVTMKMPLK